LIVISEYFDVAAARAEAAVDLYLNNVDIDLADDLRRSVTRSVAEFDAPQLGLLGELHGPSSGVLLPNPYRVAVAEHDLRDTNVSFLQYQVIPIVVLIVISVGVLGTALLTARDFEHGRAKMLLLSPAGGWALVVGRLLGGALITIGLVVPLVALGFLTHHIPYCAEESGAPLWLTQLLSGPCGWMLPPVSWTPALALVALLGAVTLATVGFGTVLGVALRDTRLVTMTAHNASAYLFFLGSGLTTVAFPPHWLQVASRFVPTSYAIGALPASAGAVGGTEHAGGDRRLRLPPARHDGVHVHGGRFHPADDAPGGAGGEPADLRERREVSRAGHLRRSRDARGRGGGRTELSLVQ